MGNIMWLSMNHFRIAQKSTMLSHESLNSLPFEQKLILWPAKDNYILILATFLQGIDIMSNNATLDF